MDKRLAYVFFGMFAAVILGVYIVKREGDGDILDQIGDVIADLTSTDESNLAKLEPETQAQARALINSLAADGLTVKVGQTLRTPAQEKSAIAAGKSAVKTHSWHEIGRAMDLYPINPDTGSADLNGLRDDLFQQMQQKALAFGFQGIAYNGDWSRRYITTSKGQTWDGGHLEYHGPWSTIADAVAAEGANYGIG